MQNFLPVKNSKKKTLEKKIASEKIEKSAREKQTLPVKIFEKCNFLQNFHGQMTKNPLELIKGYKMSQSVKIEHDWDDKL